MPMNIMHMNTYRSCRGVTLVELLVGLVVGAILILAVIAAWSLSARTAAFTLSSSRLNHDLRAMMQTMSQDLRRADGGAGVPTERTVRFGGTGQCITYYVENVGRGFRMDGDVFEMFFSADSTIVPDCASGVGWIPVYGSLAQGGLVITDFQVGWRATCYPFDPDDDDIEEFSSSTSPIQAPHRCNGLDDVTEVLEVTLNLSGQFGTGAQVKSATLNQAVTVRNNVIH
jgi:prepilin-type N-terminal cleavage/methylation domain-containing protein